MLHIGFIGFVAYLRPDLPRQMRKTKLKSSFFTYTFWVCDLLAPFRKKLPKVLFYFKNGTPFFAFSWV